VPHGPRAYRTQLRVLGPIAALAPPAVLALAALLALAGDGSPGRGVVGFVCAVLAAPGLLVAGVPLATGGGTWALALLGSAALWIALGSVASRRATSTPVASWRDYWRELSWLAIAVWVGVALALVATQLLIGRALL